nr:unnamed protein product [Digitaria exilis]
MRHRGPVQGPGNGGDGGRQGAEPMEGDRAQRQWRAAGRDGGRKGTEADGGWRARGAEGGGSDVGGQRREGRRPTQRLDLARLHESRGAATACWGLGGVGH